MRVVVYGAGGIGGVTGGLLHQTGHDVTLVARGPHLAALQASGLRLDTPGGSVTLALPAVGGPAEVDWQGDEVVLLAMKGQDTPTALRALAAAAPPAIGVVCLQNGVDNERQALRHFASVYAVPVMMPTNHLEPGVVQSYSTPTPGILDVGRYPSGLDDRAEAISAAFAGAGFASVARADVMRWKWAKLLMNLGNAIEAMTGDGGRGGGSGDDEATASLYGRARAEGEACLEAAGIDYTSMAEDRERRGDLLQMKPIDGQRRGGGSTWQSLARGTGAVEADLLNGEIVRLGRTHGVPTPVNELLQRRVNRAAREGLTPGAVTAAELLADLD